MGRRSNLGVVIMTPMLAIIMPAIEFTTSAMNASLPKPGLSAPIMQHPNTAMSSPMEFLTPILLV